MIKSQTTGVLLGKRIILGHGLVLVLLFQALGWACLFGGLVLTRDLMLIALGFFVSGLITTILVPLVPWVFLSPKNVLAATLLLTD
jgi:hypothetical protein